MAALTYLGRIFWRRDSGAFGIHAADLFAIMYVVAKTGTGKSSFLESLVRQDIVNGHELALFDPHAIWLNGCRRGRLRTAG
jgi:hypothetical protein